MVRGAIVAFPCEGWEVLEYVDVELKIGATSFPSIFGRETCSTVVVLFSPDIDVGVHFGSVAFLLLGTGSEVSFRIGFEAGKGIESGTVSVSEEGCVTTIIIDSGLDGLRIGSFFTSISVSISRSRGTKIGVGNSILFSFSFDGRVTSVADPRRTGLIIIATVCSCFFFEVSSADILEGRQDLLEKF